MLAIMTLLLYYYWQGFGLEAAFLPSDVDFDKGILHIDKALQYHDLKVDEFYFDTTKTVNADREVALPIAASEAIQRTIKEIRNLKPIWNKILVLLSKSVIVYFKLSMVLR